MNRTVRTWLIVGVAVVVLVVAGVLTGVLKVPWRSSENGSSAGLPNPASVYCEEQGYTVEIRTAEDGGEYGVCIFSDGSECDEWAFYRGECAPGGEE